ncbi:unnamed protein product [Ostreobium quekettii]|uniref:Uncharacterized protein n=1 Tax=Ostreobium quekettii TaxID=121088 RepID=A0A8S1J031_9CHLO|nr:unnamed protein product [Ostreobium quekettii]|eukprot:evm.model.scf_1776.4 EVM.evm.TU.scf_1776.4   scf_1776:29706-33503(-)
MALPGNHKRGRPVNEQGDEDPRLRAKKKCVSARVPTRATPFPPRSYRPHYGEPSKVGAFKGNCERLVGLLQERLDDVEIAKPADISVDDISFLREFKKRKTIGRRSSLPNPQSCFDTDLTDSEESCWSEHDMDEWDGCDPSPAHQENSKAGCSCAAGTLPCCVSENGSKPAEKHRHPAARFGLFDQVLMSFSELTTHLGSVFDFLMRGRANDKYRKAVEVLLTKIAANVAQDAEGTKPSAGGLGHYNAQLKRALCGRNGQETLSEGDREDKLVGGIGPSSSSVGLVQHISEVVVVLRVHKAAWRNCRAGNTYNTGWQATDILALGRHALSEVLDVIRCPADSNLASVNKSVNSAYLFIEGVFYNDTRQPGAVDASREIRDFCTKHKTGWPLHPESPHDWQFEVADIDGTKVEEMWLRAGNKPLYLYCHQACCEHLMSILDVRLLHSEDPWELSQRPVVVNEPKERGRKCYICRKKYSTKVTYQNPLVLYNPCFLCNECFQMLHYDKNGDLLLDQVIVFPYSHER